MNSNFRFLPAVITSVFLVAMFITTPAARAEDHVALQLYSLRAQLGKDAPTALDEVKNWGITNVELAGTYNLTPEQFKVQLDARGLNAFSGHFAYDRLRAW